MRLNIVLAFLIFRGFFAFCLANAATPMVKSGPYVSTLTKVKQCDKTSFPYLKDPIFTAYIENNDKNKNHIKGNLTVLRDVSNVKTNIQDFYSEGGKWQMTFKMKNLSCRSHFVSSLLDSVYMMYDKKTCEVPKGTYDFDADFDNLEHIWMTTREYGRMMRRVETVNGRRTVACLELEADVRPLAGPK